MQEKVEQEKVDNCIMIKHLEPEKIKIITNHLAKALLPTIQQLNRTKKATDKPSNVVKFIEIPYELLGLQVLELLK